MDAQQDTHGVHRLCNLIQDSANRIKLVVYPALFAFIILAAYGFYLIYNLTRDVHYLAVSVNENMSTIAHEMTTMSHNMQQIESHLASVNEKMSDVAPIRDEMSQMRQSMNQMNHAIHGMNANTHMMQRDMRNISKPMSFFGSFFPF